MEKGLFRKIQGRSCSCSLCSKRLPARLLQAMPCSKVNSIWIFFVRVAKEVSGRISFLRVFDIQ